MPSCTLQHSKILGCCRWLLSALTAKPKTCARVSTACPAHLYNLSSSDMTVLPAPGLPTLLPADPDPAGCLSPAPTRYEEVLSPGTSGRDGGCGQGL